MSVFVFLFFFFKQKTAYEVRISDWSSDVCSSDLRREDPQAPDSGPHDEMEALRAEIEQLRADALRERADLDNQRKRMSRELETARRFANERLLTDQIGRASCRERVCQYV